MWVHLKITTKFILSESSSQLHVEVIIGELSAWMQAFRAERYWPQWRIYSQTLFTLSSNLLSVNKNYDNVSTPYMYQRCRIRRSVRSCSIINWRLKHWYQPANNMRCESTVLLKHCKQQKGILDMLTSGLGRWMRLHKFLQIVCKVRRWRMGQTEM